MVRNDATVEVPATDVEQKEADSRGRVTLGSEYADETVTVAVLNSGPEAPRAPRGEALLYESPASNENGDIYALATHRGSEEWEVLLIDGKTLMDVRERDRHVAVDGGIYWMNLSDDVLSDLVLASSRNIDDDLDMTAAELYDEAPEVLP